jgi:hypothetical protein
MFEQGSLVESSNDMTFCVCRRFNGQNLLLKPFGVRDCVGFVISCVPSLTPAFALYIVSSHHIGWVWSNGLVKT